MPPEKTDKLVARRKKFIQVDVPLIKSKIEIIGNSPKELKDRTIKLDFTKQLKGKSVEVTVKIKIENEKAVAYPIKINLMSYFIRRMIRKRISYVEDSFLTPSQESMIKIKPFLITKRKVSRVVRKTLRNKCRNWIEDYISERKDNEIFSEILSNKMQKYLSLVLKKTYPLSLCEIRILEINRQLNPEETPKIKPREIKEKEQEKEEFIDQLKEIEDEKIKQAEKEIKEAQKKALEIEDKKAKEESSKNLSKKPKKTKKLKTKSGKETSTENK